MARRRRPGPRTSVVDGRAEIIIPVSAIETADESEPTFAAVRKWFTSLTAYPAEAAEAAEAARAPRASLTLDRFVYDLHLGDVAHQSDTHDGDSFLEAARDHGEVTVLVVDDIDPRRSKPDEIDAAAKAGTVVGGLVDAFVVDSVDP